MAPERAVEALGQHRRAVQCRPAQFQAPVRRGRSARGLKPLPPSRPFGQGVDGLVLGGGGHVALRCDVWLENKIANIEYVKR
ncbi:hypothetical protein GGP87_001322 [Salinibacter ruber]|nr:hypothetical protein [Salinibacter ruber]